MSYELVVAFFSRMLPYCFPGSIPGSPLPWSTMRSGLLLSHGIHRLASEHRLLKPDEVLLQVSCNLVLQGSCPIYVCSSILLLVKNAFILEKHSSCFWMSMLSIFLSCRDPKVTTFLSFLDQTTKLFRGYKLIFQIHARVEYSLGLRMIIIFYTGKS
jgi:hypothetical protein